MAKIKVLHIFENYSHVYQPYIPPVIEGLKQDEDLDISIVAYKGRSSKALKVVPKYLKRRLVERWYQFINKRYKNLSYIEIWALKNKTDIIHVQQSYMFPRILGLTEITKGIRPKLVVTLRGSETYVKPWVQDKWETFFKDYGNNIDAFVVMSTHQKEYLQRWGVEQDRIHVIPISFGQKFEAKPKKASKDGIKIVSVFRLCWEKNINGNLMVIKILKEQGFKVSYDVFGDGPELGKLYYLINKYHLNDSVKVHGRVDNHELKKKLGNYDFILQLSHSEAFPTSVLEAQAIGIPAIVSNAGGLPDAIQQNNSGYAMDANDTERAADYIAGLWKDVEKYYSFSKAGIDYAQYHFSVDNEVSAIKSLYIHLTK
ncbi:glycosyltransferase family 4 protein [Winogradskyella sp. A3E31]|uniref:glycosyltransferase family 4 protein n=1 Tax=Winogradskyella sp. A3E31 TaxID=3349637 RepID=UPI00398AE045